MVTAQSYQRHPLCRFAALPPKGAARAVRSTTPKGGSEALGSPMGELSSKARLRGCGSLNGNSSKLRAAPPLPLRGTSPKGGSEGCATHHPQRGQRGPRLPNGGAVEQSETEGVLFVEWQQLKVTNGTPFAASRHFPQRGQRGLRGAPPPEGAASLGSFRL